MYRAPWPSRAVAVRALPTLVRFMSNHTLQRIRREDGGRKLCGRNDDPHAHVKAPAHEDAVVEGSVL